MTKQVVIQIGIVCLATAFLAAGDEPSEANWQTFVDGTQKVTLRCPADWKPVPPYDVAPAMRSQDRSRDFGLSAEGGENNTAQQLCKDDAEHILRPFGTNPAIRPMKVQGQSACLIWPSADQKKLGGDNGAKLIVKYPEPVKIDDTVYSFLTLYADKNYILALIRSLKFLAPDPKNAPFVMEIAFDGIDGSDAVFKIGAPVVLTLTLRNNSERVLRIPFSDRDADYRIIVSEIGDRTELIAKYQPPEQQHKAAPAAEPVTLNPHSVYQTKIDTGLQYQLLSPFVHTLHGQMRLPAELGPGLVNSNTMRLTLVAGQGSETQPNQNQRQRPSTASPRN